VARYSLIESPTSARFQPIFGIFSDPNILSESGRTVASSCYRIKIDGCSGYHGHFMFKVITETQGK